MVYEETFPTSMWDLGRLIYNGHTVETVESLEDSKGRENKKKKRRRGN